MSGFWPKCLGDDCLRELNVAKLPDILPLEGQRGAQRRPGLQTSCPQESWSPSLSGLKASRHVLRASIQLAFSLPIGGGKKLHHPREPGSAGGRSVGLPQELQLGHHQRGAGGQATAQGLLRAQ